MNEDVKVNSEHGRKPGKCYICDKKSNNICSGKFMRIMRSDVFAHFEYCVQNIVDILRTTYFCDRCSPIVNKNVYPYIASVYSQFGEDIKKYDTIMGARGLRKYTAKHIANYGNLKLCDAPNLNFLPENIQLFVDHLGKNSNEITLYDIMKIGHMHYESLSLVILRYFLDTYNGDTFIDQLKQFMQNYVTNVMNIVNLCKTEIPKYIPDTECENSENEYYEECE